VPRWLCYVTMPRIAKTEPTSRLSLELAQKVRNRLEELRTEVGADTLTEVVRRALALYDHVVSAKKAGGDLVLKTDKGERAVEFF